MRLPFDLFCSTNKAGISHSSLDYHSLNSSRPLNNAKTRISLNAAHGNAVVRDTEFSIKDDGLTLTVGMIWNSSDQCWRFAATPKILIANQSLTLTEPDGRSVQYIRRDDQTYICAEPGQDGLSLVTITGNTYERFSPATGIRELYDAGGRLQSKLLPNGKEIKYQEYDAAGEIKSIKLPSGRELNLAQDPRNANKRNLTLAGEQLASYEFNDINNPAALTTRIPQPDQAEFVTCYAFSGNSLQIHASDKTNSVLNFNPEGVITSLTEGGRTWTAQLDQTEKSFSIGADRNALFKVTYDDYDHLESFKAPADSCATRFSCDNKTGCLQKIIDTDGESHTINYDPDTGLASRFIEDNHDKSTQLVYQTTGSSQSFGLKLAEIKWDGPRFAARYFIYNENRQPIYEISPAGRITQFCYKDERLISKKQVTTTRYPVSNAKVTLPQRKDVEDWWGELTSFDLSLLQVSSFGYDAFGRQNSQTTYTSVDEAGEGIETKTDTARVNQVLDNIGHVKQTDLAAGFIDNQVTFRTTREEFDNLNRVRAIHEGAQAGSKTVLDTTYDYADDNAVIHHPNGLIETLTHDEGGLIKKKERSGRVETNLRNNNGSISSVTREDGQKEYHYCDASGRLQYQVLPGGELSEYQYDARGKLRCKKKYKITVDPTDPGLDIGSIIKASTASLSNYEFYNSQEELCYEVTVKDIAGVQQGFITQHQYLLGNKVATIRHEKPLEAGEIIKLNINYLDANVQANNPLNRITRYFYDKDDLLIGEQVLTDALPKALGFTKIYERDGAGNITHEIVYLDKNEFSNELDPAALQNLRKSVTRHFYDNAGRKFSTLDADDYLTTYTYNADGKINSELHYYNKMNGKQVTHDNDKRISTVYDDLGRVSRITNSQTNLQIDIKYDLANNEIERVLTDLGTNPNEVRKMRKEYNLFNEVIYEATPRVCAQNNDVNNKSGWFATIVNPITGLILSKTDAMGNTTHYFYDNNRRPQYVITADGACKRYTYDPVCGKPAEIYCYYQPNKQFVADLKTDKLRSGFTDLLLINSKFQPDSDSRDRVTKNTYDGEGLLITQIDPNGAVHLYANSSFREVEAEIHQVDIDKELRLRHKHDLRGNSTETIKDPKRDEQDTTALNIRTAQKYDDAFNRVTEKTSESGATTQISYIGLRQQQLKDGSDPSRNKSLQQDAFNRTTMESDWTGSNVINHDYIDKQRKHITHSAVNSSRDIAETSNAFAEITQRAQNGRSTAFLKDVDGETRETIYADGSRQTDEHNILGLTEKQTDQNGKQTGIDHDELGRVKTIADDLSGVKRVSSFKSNAFGENEQTTQADGLIKENEFKNAGSIQVTTSDPDKLKLGQTTSYNLAGGLKQILQGDGKNNYQENIERDVLNRETGRTVALGEDKQLVLKNSVLDAAGNVVVETDGDGSSIRKIYDNRGNLRFKIDEEGFVIEKTYDFNNRETSERCYANRIISQDNFSLDNIKKYISPCNQDSLRQKVYDADGLLKYDIRLLESTSDNQNKSRIIEYSYNGNNERIQTKSYAASFDNRDLNTVPDMATVFAFVSQEKSANQAKNRISDYCRNKMGRRALKRDPENYIVEKRYDAKGKVTARIHYSIKQPELDLTKDYDTARSNIKAHADDRENFYIYDSFGNLRYEIDGEGFVIEHVYDKGNRPTDHFHYFNKLSARLSREELTALYTALRNPARDIGQNTALLSLMESAANCIHDDTLDVYAREEYDIAGRTISKTDGEGFKEKYQLNALGLSEIRTDKRNNNWVTEFDGAKRPKSETSPSIETTLVKQDGPVVSALQASKTTQQRKTATTYDACSNPQLRSVGGTVDSTDQRQIEKLYNKKKQFIGTRIKGVRLDNGADNKDLKNTRPEEMKDISTRNILDYSGRKLVEINEAGAPTFHVYDANGRERFLVDSEGNVTEYKYEFAFNEHTRLTRHAAKVDKQKLEANKYSGLKYEDLTAQFTQNNSDDRTVSLTRNNLGLITSAKKDAIFSVWADQHNGEPHVAFMSPQSDYVYNAFGEVIRKEDLIDGSGKRAVTLQLYDHNGNITNSISPKGYFTKTTYGMKNIDPDKPGYIKLNKTERYNRMRAGWDKLDHAELTPEKMAELEKSTINPLFDRRYDWLYDRRLLVKQTKVTSGLDLYKAAVNPDGSLRTEATGKSVTEGFEYDEEGQIKAYVNDKGEKRYLFRNAVGDVVFETEFPLQLQANANPVIPAVRHSVNIHGEAVGSARLANPVTINQEKPEKPAVAASAGDQQILILKDNRGCVLVTQTPQGNLKFSTYNELRKLVRHYYWVRGYKLNGKAPTIIPQLRVTKNAYNSKQQCTMTSRADDYSEVATHTAYNSFEERIGEGPAPDTMLLTWDYDKAGNNWFTNSDKGIPTISFHDLSGNEVVHFRSGDRKKDLSLYLKDRAKAIADLLNKPYETIFRQIQRTSLIRDEEGNVARQFIPWFSHQRQGVAQVRQMSFTVIDNPRGLKGRYIVWRPSNEKLLTGKFKMRVKGTKEWQVFDEIIVPKQNPAADEDLRAINISDLVSDEYEYQLDLYLKDPDKEPDRSPSFSALGEVMLDTGKYQGDKPVWRMANNNTLIITGKTDNVTGIELIQDGKAIKRVAGSRNTNGEIVIDLSSENSGDYDFKIVTGTNSDDRNVVPVETWQPSYRFNSPTTVAPVNPLPPGVNLSQNYLQAGQPLLGREISFGDKSPDHVIWPAGTPIPGVYLYGTDNNHNQLFLGHMVGYVPRSGFGYLGDYSKLPVMNGEPVVLVRPTSNEPLHAIKIGDQTFTVKPWLGGAYIVKAAPSQISAAQATVVSLDSASTTDQVGKLSIRTNKPGNKMVGREISVTDINLSHYELGGVWRCAFQTEGPVSRMIHYTWKTNAGQDHYLQVGQNAIKGNVSDVSFAGTGLPDPVYMQTLLPHPDRSAPGPMDLSLVLPGKCVIPLGTGLYAHNTPVAPHRENLCSFNDTASFERQLLNRTNYDPVYAMYFSPIPAGTAKIVLEYAEYTPTNNINWITNALCTISGNGFSLSLNNINPGNYQFRFKALDANNKPLDTSCVGLPANADEWTYSNMEVQKSLPGQMQFVSKNKEQSLEIKKPCGACEQDRYQNKTSETTRSGHRTDKTYNLFNQIATILAPESETTDNHGNKNRTRAKTEYRHNTSAQKVSVITPANQSDDPAKRPPKEEIHLQNNAGDTLRTMDEDGVLQSSIYDIFRRIVSTGGMTGNATTSQFSIIDGLNVEERTDANGHKETFVTNEEKQRISYTNQLLHTWYYNYNWLLQEILRINPSLTTQERLYDLRTGILKRLKDESGSRQYNNRPADDDDKNGIDPDPVSPIDEYVGNIVSHIDFAGQVINYLLNPNKQVMSEAGKVNAAINLKRGITDQAGNPPPARNILYNRSEAGHMTDIIDLGAGIETHKEYTVDDYCETCLFIGKDGRIYQSNFTDYDEMLRVAKIRDTRIMMQLGYDANSNRRYARAFVQGDHDDDTWCFRESWFDYTSANRPIVRDGILKDENGTRTIDIKNGQGMKIEFEFEKGLAKIITEIKNNKPQYKILGYDNLNLLKSLLIKNNLKGSAIYATVFTRDAAQQVTDTVNQGTCNVYFAAQQPPPSTTNYYDIPTYVLSYEQNGWKLVYYVNKTATEIKIENDEKLDENFKDLGPILTLGEQIHLQNVVKDYYSRTNGNFNRATTGYNIDGGILRQINENIVKGGNKTITDRQINQPDDAGIPVNETMTTHGELGDEDNKGSYDLVERIDNSIVCAENKSIGNSSAKTVSIKGKNVDIGKVERRANIKRHDDANMNVTFVSGNLPAHDTKPESYREFIVNSENCVIVKETANGRNYYFYVEKRPGKTVMMAYFGDLPPEITARLKVKGALNKINDKLPNTINMDLNHSPITSQYPPAAASQYTTVRDMTLTEIAEDLNYTGYAAFIAQYNNMNVDTVVKARETIKIPPLYAEIPDTAWNGSAPSIDTLIGGLYPTLPVPAITMRPKGVNWFEIYFEVTTAVAIMAAAPELIAPLLGVSLTTIGGAALACGIAGALAGTVDQAIAMGYGSQHSFNTKSVFINALTSAISGGLSEAMQGPKIAADACFAIRAGAAARNAVTAEVIALAQQAALVATGLQRSPNWNALAAAPFDAMVGIKLVKGDEIEDRVANAAFAKFAQTLGDAVIYHQRINGQDISAAVLGSMVGTYLGSKALEHTVDQNQHAIRMERGEGRHEAAASSAHAYASIGQGRVASPDLKATPKPHYAKAPEDRDVSAAKADTMQFEKDGDIARDNARDNRSDRWNSEVSAMRNHAAQFFNRNADVMKEVMRDLVTLDNVLMPAGSNQTPTTTSSRLVTAVNDAFWVGVDYLYNESMAINNELYNDITSHRYGSALIDIGKPIAQAIIADTIVGGAAYFARPLLNGVASSLGAGNYAVEYGAYKASQFVGSTLLASRLALTPVLADLTEGFAGGAKSAVYSSSSKVGLFGKVATGGESVVNTGGRQLTSTKAVLNADREASNFYNQVRASKSNADVIQISKNTGIPEYRIQRIKEHVFINEHTLSGGRVAQFDPYIEISDAWSRLQGGNFVEQDIQLLHHEYFESRFEGIFKTDYTAAHNAAINSGRTWNPDEFISPTPMINRRS